MSPSHIFLIADSLVCVLFFLQPIAVGTIPQQDRYEYMVVCQAAGSCYRMYDKDKFDLALVEFSLPVVYGAIYI